MPRGTRIGSLSTRCARAVELLRARVAVAQEAQTQKLLVAMADTGRAQLRLQETVEGLSVAAISYYVLSLLGYAIKPFEFGGWLKRRDDPRRAGAAGRGPGLDADAPPADQAVAAVAPSASRRRGQAS